MIGMLFQCKRDRPPWLHLPGFTQTLLTERIIKMIITRRLPKSTPLLCEFSEFGDGTAIALLLSAIFPSDCDAQPMLRITDLKQEK